MKIYQLEYIDTPRLIIRPIASGDEVEINAAINRSLPSLQRWMPWSKDPSYETTHTFVEKTLAGWQSENATEFPLVVIHKDTKKIIAVTGYNDRSVPVIPSYEIGYWIDTEFEGKGYVSEFVNAISRYAFDALSAQRVQITTQVDNIKSIRVAENCGYTREFTMKNFCLDCQSGLPADSFLCACYRSASLPTLKIDWYHDKKSTKPNDIITKSFSSSTATPLKPLETKRLRLLPPRIEDAKKVHDALMTSIAELAPYFSWATEENLNLNEVTRHIEEDAIAAKDIKANSELFYFVWNKENNIFLGEVWLKILDWSVMSAYCAYWFDTRYTGNGYAREAVANVVKYAFEDLNAKRIAIDVSIENENSLKLPLSLNFTFEGVMKNYFHNFVTHSVCDGKRFALTDFSHLSYDFNQNQGVVFELLKLA